MGCREQKPFKAVEVMGDTAILRDMIILGVGGTMTLEDMVTLVVMPGDVVTMGTW